MSLDYRAVAQLVEHRSPKPAVAGSSPSCPAGKVQVTGYVCDNGEKAPKFRAPYVPLSF